MELIKAVKDNDYKKVLELIKNGANVNGVSERDEIPLIIAAEGGMFDIVKLLIENGADVNTKGSLGYTVTMSAILYEHFDIAKYLIEKGADINAENQARNTVLRVACGRDNSFTFIKYLLKKGAKATPSNPKMSPFERVKNKKETELILLFAKKGIPLHESDYKELKSMRFNAKLGKDALEKA